MEPLQRNGKVLSLKKTNTVKVTVVVQTSVRFVNKKHHAGIAGIAFDVINNRVQVLHLIQIIGIDFRCCI